MSRAVFLDVGAHEGQTLEEVTRPRWAFDVYAFEPMPVQFRELERRFGDHEHVTLLNYGLSDRTGFAPVYGTNDRMEASIYPTKDDVDETEVTVCQFVAASEFFRSLPEGGEVIVKLNCEGAEVPILNNLIDTGQIWKVTRMMVDFDIRKVVGHEAGHANIERRLADIGFTDYAVSWDVMLGDTHQQRIAHWLTYSHRA